MRHSRLCRPWNHQTSPIRARLAHLRHLFTRSDLPHSAGPQAALRRHQVRLSVPQQQILQLQARRRPLHTRRQSCTWPASRNADPKPLITKKRSRSLNPLILPRLRLSLILNPGEDLLSDLHGIRLFKEVKKEEDVPLLLINSVLLIPHPFNFINNYEWVADRLSCLHPRGSLPRLPGQQRTLVQPSAA